jgi:hypothetical protein
MALNGHQVAAGKRLESYDEHLMLITSVVSHYNMQRYYK